ncbi:hypothetical protein EBL87_09060 [Cereibacter sphaeroides]|uniref:hypothetical protein n=1 Tax=Cereibacter sphaeroides TaxID=1063 RepID=UPI000F51D59A|nr:hypothetical protein [Cereibacter sphaeroides]AZB63877.1 hypothetical protein EBL87_09060 [Cereibacter sphaeroides]AZB68201.1 hypothetical protein EBL86_07410 [Cereibacter sphaeroides]
MKRDEIIRALEGEIAKRDRMIQGFLRAGRRRRGGDEPAPRQAELGIAAFPVTEFAMGPGAHLPLPDTLQDVAEVIGREAALRLAEGLPQCGSRSWRRMVYVPQKMKEGHPLVRLIGRERAEELRRSHTNMILEVPVCVEIRAAYREHVIRRLKAAEMPEQEIARMVGVDVAAVRAVAAAAPEEGAACHGQSAGDRCVGRT